jgi:hypothetical protein
MSQDHVRTDRSYPLDAYEYLRTAATSDWAWEYLRRNPDYQSDALLQNGSGVVRQHLANGALLTRLHAHHLRAEAWGLCCFRRSTTDSRASPSRLAA